MIDVEHLVAVLVLVVLVSGVGCTYPEASENSVEFSGTVERVDGQFHMDGDISVHGTNERDIEGVAVVLYHENRTVIERIPVGSVSSRSDGPHPVSRSVNITTGRLPVYILIEYPDLWDEGVPAEAYHWTGERYSEYWVETGDDRFPSE